MENEKVYKKAISLETFVFLGLVGIFFGYASSVMGVDKMFNTLMNTAHYLLIDVVFFIMAIAVLAGAFGALLSEFGVIALINRMISPIMGPIYGLPGAASLGMLTTYLSDNPAILALAHDRGFKQFFTDEQLPTLCNLGTAFGMGLILTTYMIGLGNGVEFIVPVLIGNLGAVIGSVVSVRMMRHYTRRYFASDLEATASKSDLKAYFEYREIRSGSIFERILDAVLEGGKAGVELGLAIIPGVVVICTIIMLLTFGPSEATGLYTGAKKEGVALVPIIGSFLNPIVQPLFGFSSAEAIAFPLTSLGSVGAAMGLVKELLEHHLIGANDIAVFTSMGMCWSGFLSTHVSMMDALGVRKLSSKAILSHTFGGIAAGISAHYLYLLTTLF